MQSLTHQLEQVGSDPYNEITPLNAFDKSSSATEGRREAFGIH